ncbi:MAG: hypothetical protein RIQ40_327, partial [Planctomycetota bacterium]
MKAMQNAETGVPDQVALSGTPLFPVRLGSDQPVIWCKAEYLHPSGSTKDRIAAHILGTAWRKG